MLRLRARAGQIVGLIANEFLKRDVISYFHIQDPPRKPLARLAFGITIKILQEYNPTTNQYTHALDDNL